MTRGHTVGHCTDGRCCPTVAREYTLAECRARQNMHPYYEPTVARGPDARSRVAEAVYPRVATALDRHLDPYLSADSIVHEPIPVRRAEATLAVILATVLEAISGGARSATSGDTNGLTYADGWTSAATLARLVAADAMAELISPRE